MTWKKRAVATRVKADKAKTTERVEFIRAISQIFLIAKNTQKGREVLHKNILQVADHILCSLSVFVSQCPSLLSGVHCILYTQQQFCTLNA